MALSLDPGWAPAQKLSFYKQFLSTFQQKKKRLLFFLFLHSKFINSRLPLFPFIKYNEATEWICSWSVLLSVSCGTKGCFMASVKKKRGGGSKRARQTWSSKRGGDAPLLFRCILMANLLSSVPLRMIRTRCFLEKCKLLDLPGARCHFDSPVWTQRLPK